MSFLHDCLTSGNGASCATGLRQGIEAVVATLASARAGSQLMEHEMVQEFELGNVSKGLWRET